MSRRTPLAVAVVGALLIGGATTGTTHALWRDTTPMPPISITSGTMSHAVSLPGETPPAMPALVAGGPAAVTAGTVRDTSSPGARNLRQDISVTDVVLRDATNQLKLSDLGVAVTPRPPSGCASNFTDAVTGEDAHLGRTAPNGPDASIEVCLTVVAKAGTPSSTGTLLLAFSGEQVRPGGQPAGWTSASTATVGLTVTSGPAVPPALVLRCDSEKGTKILWDARATSYNVYESESLAFGSEPITTTTSNQYTRDAFPHDTNATRYFKVRSTSNGIESPDSNIIKIRRNGASANVSCGAP